MGSRERETIVVKVTPALLPNRDGQKFSWITTSDLGTVSTTLSLKEPKPGAIIQLYDNPNGLLEVTSVRPGLLTWI